MGLLLAVGVLVVQADAVVAGWQRLTAWIGVAGEPIAATQPVLSDHEIERMAELPPQEQAVGLLEAAITGYVGARELIEAELDGWRGEIRLEGGLQRLVTTALNSRDLRVRASGIEISLAAHGFAKTSEEAWDLMGVDEPSPWNLWVLGLLASRGVEPDAIFDHLAEHLTDPDPDRRHWAIEGMAYSGDERMIPHLLDVFRDDPSPRHQERAACSLAQSGMLSAEARYRAVPAFIEYLEEPSFERQRRRWSAQALRDISGRRDLRDAEAWRRWWERERRRHDL